MDGNLFEGLPPPSHRPHQEQHQQQEGERSHQAPESSSSKTSSSGERESTPRPPLKSALKRPKASEVLPEETAPGKRLRFKTTTDASEAQVVEAMQKIASHIKNPSKFAKASKLAIQLIQAGSVKPGTSDYFFNILDAAMSSQTCCTDPSVRADYHALFSATQDVNEFFAKKQKSQFFIWTLKAVVANDLFTDDSFVFSKTATKLKDAIAALPVATEDDDAEEAASLKGSAENRSDDGGNNPSKEEQGKEECDPFGLDSLISTSGKKRDDKAKAKRDTGAAVGKDDDKDRRMFLKSQREALLSCLEIAAKRYKLPWCQTVIDILVKHASDHMARFTSRQRDAIGKLWASVREQQILRKQGKSVSGKLDVNAFEWLQQKYSTEKISIRHAVGGSGERRCEQWLG